MSARAATDQAARLLQELRSESERWRLTVIEDVPGEGPRPVQELADLATDLTDLLDDVGDDVAALRRRAHQVLLAAHAWPLLTDLTEVARTRGDGWPAWLETVWLGLRDLGALVGRLDLELASRTNGQGRP